MLVYLFLFIVAAHAFFHLHCFVKAYSGGNNTLPVGTKSKGVALLWLCVCIMLLVAALLLFMQNNSWCLLAIAAVVISQVLLIKNWKHTKWGSAINFLIVLVAIPFFANHQFNKKASRASKTILARAASDPNTIDKKNRLIGLPPMVQKWLLNAGVTENAAINTVRLKQRGEMRTSLQGKWMPFTASEYFTVVDPAFVWIARVNIMPPVYLTALDKFENGQGSSDIKMFSLLSVGSSANDYNTNTASMLRYLAETCLFPSAALSDCIQWTKLDSLSAKATMRFNGTTVAGIFTFASNGDVLSFIANRFYTDAAGAKQEPWLVQFSDWKTFQGYRIPVKSKITWQLEAGDFYWANIEITEVEYNCTGIYY